MFGSVIRCVVGDKGLFSFDDIDFNGKMRNGLTPAEIAGLDLGLGQNKWKGLIQKSVENQVKCD